MQVLNLKPLPLGGHTLPALPYDYNALEPVIDSATLHIHHDKHHRKYVADLNVAEISAKKMRDSDDYHAINLIEQELAFNGSGHILHSIYWQIMASSGQGGAPGGATNALVASYFGGFDAFKEQFVSAALKVPGSGWAILGYNPYFRRLEILQASKHEDMTQWGIVPVLVCDVWEQQKVNMGTKKFLFNLRIIHTVKFCALFSVTYFFSSANSSRYLNTTSILSL